ncbi:MAG: A/G-specific adenine glycosylase [Lachnospiraceae bacterium]|nr:A/G-specific adenine glycosylase [Lachnospiraceae bacterium]
MNFDWVQIKQPLLRWYEKEHRLLPWRTMNIPYNIWISEIMLQQTRVEAVKGYYSRFLNAIPSVKELAEVSEEELLKLWEGLGYYNRAKNLQKTARIIMEKYHGNFPKEYSDVISLPGIGEYTAGAICSICYDMPTPAVDGNVLRVMTRVSENYCNIDDVKTKKLARQDLELLYQNGDCAMLTQALMELGAMVCIPNGAPKCEECPLAMMCGAFRNHTYDELPVRKKKKNRKVIEKTVFILHDKDYYGIRKRPDKGLLANMWEFTHVDYKMNKEEALQYISEEGYGPFLLEKEIPYTHIFSHVEWRMTAYYISCRNQLSNLLWVKEAELKNRYALPTAFKTFLEKEF